LIGAFFLEDGVAGDAEAARLGVFEEHALVVVVGVDHVAAVEGAQDAPLDEAAGRGKPAVQVDRSDDRLEAIGRNGVVSLAERSRGAGTGQDEVGKADGAGVGSEGFPVDQTGAHLGQLPLFGFRERPVKILSHDQVQDGIAEELQSFIGDARVVALLEG
jgi:hypothetical protein